MTSTDSMLAGTPYVIPEDAESQRSFAKVLSKNSETSLRAQRVREQIGQEAEELLGPFLFAQRSDLVAESNQMEGYDVSRRQVQDAVRAHEELLDGPVHSLLEVLKADPKIVTALGLYKAQLLADEWAHRADRPMAFELRQLHALIVVDDHIGGRFRTFDVGIGGTTFRPPRHFDVEYNMQAFIRWWIIGTGDPVLDATVAHAWLTHIHPFEDGNGRLARVLANLVLASAGYPPLIVRAESDRGEYYAALAASDAGNILPLYTLFGQVIRRTTRVMAAPNYVHDLLEGRLLQSVEAKRAAWSLLAEQFFNELEGVLASAGWRLSDQGLPTRESFALLSERDSAGNSWVKIVSDEVGQWQWLIWCGFNSEAFKDLCGASGYPSFFVSRKTAPESPHPFFWSTGMVGIEDEIVLVPLQALPALTRSAFETRSLTAQGAARHLASGLLHPSNRVLI